MLSLRSVAVLPGQCFCAPGFFRSLYTPRTSKTKQRMVLRIHVKDSLLPMGKVWFLRTGYMKRHSHCRTHVNCKDPQAIFVAKVWCLPHLWKCWRKPGIGLKSFVAVTPSRTLNEVCEPRFAEDFIDLHDF